MNNDRFRRIGGLAILLVPTLSFCQKTPNISQKSDQSTCSSIVALAGNVNINCSSLTPSQRKTLADIPALLNKILANQLDPDAVMAKLDEILKATSKPAQDFNCERSNCGGTLINPQVNNFGPPPAILTAHEETITPLSVAEGVDKVMKVHIATDRSIPGAKVGIVFSGPFTFTKEYWEKNGPKLVGSSLQQIDLRGPLYRGGIALPNSLAVIINMPASFDPGEDIVILVTSSSDVHVTQVMQIQE